MLYSLLGKTSRRSGLLGKTSRRPKPKKYGILRAGHLGAAKRKKPKRKVGGLLGSTISKGQYGLYALNTKKGGTTFRSDFV